MNQHIWEERYRSGQTGWDRGRVSPALETWLADGTLAPCRILVPGCGYGHEVLTLARRGFDVTALDFADTPVRALRERLAAAGLRAEVVQADALTWQPDAPFDAIYEQTCLCALPPERWPDYERQLHRWLTPGGRLLALFMQAGAEGGPPFHCALPDMRALFPASRWAWSEQLMDVPHSPGKHELGFILTRLPTEDG